MLSKSNTYIALLSAVALIATLQSKTLGADDWKQVSDVGKAGWSAEKLEIARKQASQIGSAAVLVIDHGNVIAAWGNIQYPFKMASIRKSIYDAAMGATHLQKPFKMQTTVGEMHLDDLQPLSDIEKSATLEQLTSATSGIYHPAAYEHPSNAALRPKRGSHKPGEFWYYNNWDFNMVAHGFEKLSGIGMKEAIVKNLSKQLGMQDVREEYFFECLEPRLSQHAALTIRMSARDLARIGQLYLQEGQWNGQQVVSKEWVDKSTKSITIFEEGHYRGEGNGYGRMWWIYPARNDQENGYEAYHRIAARGAGGQFMVLMPEIDVLIVHLADTQNTPGVNGRDGYELMKSIMAARIGDTVENYEIQAVVTKQLESAPKGGFSNDYKPVSENIIKQSSGTYMFNPKVGVKLYEHEGKLFLQPVGMPYTDVELFRRDDGSFGSPVVPISLKFELPSSESMDQVKSLQFTFQGRTMNGKRTH